MILQFDIWCSKMLSKGCLCCACRFCLAGLQHLLLAGGIYRHLICWVFLKLKLPFKWTISGGAKPLPQCQVVPESRHRGPGWVCEVTKDDLPDCEVSKVLSRKIFRSLYLYLWCPCQWKYARSRNKHARPKRNSEYFFTIRLFPTHQTTSYYGPIVLYIDLLAIVPGDELAMIIRRKKRKKKTHLSQEVHQLNWLLTTNTKSQAIGGDILPNLMPISVKFTLS